MEVRVNMGQCGSILPQLFTSHRSNSWDVHLSFFGFFLIGSIWFILPHISRTTGSLPRPDHSCCAYRQRLHKRPRNSRVVVVSRGAWCINQPWLGYHQPTNHKQHWGITSHNNSIVNDYWGIMLGLLIQIIQHNHQKCKIMDEMGA